MIDQETHIRLGGLTSEMRHIMAGQTAMSNTLNIVVQDVRELRNEVAGISISIVELAKGWDSKFTAMDVKIDSVDTKIDSVDTKIDAARAEMDTRFIDLKAEMDTRFTDLKAEMDTRFTELRAEMDTRFTEVLGAIRALRG